MDGVDTVLVLQWLYEMKRQLLDLSFRQQNLSTTGQLSSKTNLANQMAIGITGESFFLLTLSAWCWRCTQQAATLTLRSQNFLLPGKPHRNESRLFMSYLTWINLDKYVLLNGQENFIRWTNLKKNYLRNLPMQQRPNAMTSANTVVGKMAHGSKQLGGSVPKKLMDTGGLSTPKAISFFLRVHVLLAPRL